MNMRQRVGLATTMAFCAALAMASSALAQGSFVGPGNGGGWSGTVSGSNLVYNGQTYLIVNGRVNFPDCTTYIVAPNGALMGRSATPNCTPSTTGTGVATPSITWATPGAVTVGTALSGTQLNATASVAGTFVYSPSAGTAMHSAGSQPLSVTFTPTDLVNYTTTTTTVRLQVNSAGAASFLGPANGGGWSGNISGSNLIYNGQTYPIVNGRVNFPDCTTYIVAPNAALMGGSATPNCTPGNGGSTRTLPAITWAPPAAVNAGTTLSGTQLNATANVAGTFVYTPPAGTVMNSAGSQMLSVTFTPADLVNYTTATTTVQLQVNGTGSVSFVGPANGGGWSGSVSGSNLIYNGQTYLIVNGRVNFPDCTTYIVAPNGALMGGSATPNCTPGSGGGSATVAVAPVLTWVTPAAVAAGTALSAAQLSATANVAGAFVYTPPAGTVMATAGTQTLAVTFTPTDLVHYTVASTSVTLTVNRVTPTITWPAPATMPYGTALSATQLNATANAPGAFVYNPAAGTVFNTLGSRTLSVAFTPTDPTTYNAASASVTVLVTFTGPGNGAGWSGTVSGSTLIYNGVSFPIVNGRVSFPDCTTYIVAPNGALGGGSATANCTPGSGGSGVGQATPTITWVNPAAIAVGTVLSAAQLNATASVAGTFVYTPAAGTAMNTAGTQTLSVAFTPTDLVTYAATTKTVQLQVNAASTSFLGPANGGGWSGTISGSNLIYNAQTYAIVNGRVNFPDCTTYIVGPNGALMGGSATRNCTPGVPASQTPPAGGSGSSGSTGQVGGTTTAISVGGLWAFDAAYDAATGRYLVVGYGSYVVYGQFIGRDGVLIGSQFVIAPVGAWRPRVASNGNGLFAVVYTGLYGSNYSLEVRMVEVAPRNWSGGVSPATVIKAGTDIALTFQTSIAWSPSLQQFLIPWAVSRGPSVGVSVSGIHADDTLGLGETPIVEGMPCGNTGVYAKRALSEIAMAPDGTTMIVGYTDTTSAECAAFGGLWYRALAPNGVPIGQAGIVQGTVDGGLHREHRVAYSPVMNRFLAVWTHSTDMPPTIYGQKLAGDGTRDGDAYVVLAGNFTNADVTDNGYGQVGLAYDPSIDRFEVAVRGNDPGNGIAPLWRIRLGSDGLPMNMTPQRTNPATLDPFPTVTGDRSGNFLVVYRLDYARVVATLITP